MSMEIIIHIHNTAYYQYRFRSTIYLAVIAVRTDQNQNRKSIIIIVLNVIGMTVYFSSGICAQQ